MSEQPRGAEGRAYLTPPNVDTVIEYIRRFADRHNLSHYKLSKLAGLNKNTMLGMDRPDWSPNVRTLRALHRAMVAYLAENQAQLDMPFMHDHRDDPPSAGQG